MNKYLHVFKTSFINQTSYNSFFVMFLLGNILAWAVLILFWKGVYASGNHIGNYTLSGLILYYTFVAISMVVFQRSVFFDIASNIDGGEASQFLVRPLSYLWYQLWKELGKKTFVIFILTPAWAAILWYFRTAIALTPIGLAWLALTLILGFLLFMFSGFIFAILVMWIPTSTNLGPLLYSTVSTLLAGQMIPISIMPAWLIRIAEWSPFPYMTFYPIQLMIGEKSSLTEIELLRAVTWLMVLGIMGSYLWQRGARVYEAGGI